MVLPKIAKPNAEVLDPSEGFGVRNVWASNLTTEMDAMSTVAEKYPYVSLDAEFHGVFFATNNDRSKSTYTLIQENVTCTSAIQLGFSFFDEEGAQPPGINTWQYNFHQKITHNPATSDDKSLNMLHEAGIDFKNLNLYGIDLFKFAELFTTSSLMSNNKLTWLTFHGNYDYAYLVKMVTGFNLPLSEQEFKKAMGTFFPKSYDLKHIMHVIKLNGGLKDLRALMNVQPLGALHQAGCDSAVTGKCFFKLLKVVTEREAKLEDMENCLHMLGKYEKPSLF